MKRFAAAFFVVAAAACGESAPPPPQETARDPMNDVDAETLYRRGLTLADEGDFVRSEQYLSAAITKGYPEDRVLPKLVRLCLLGSRVRTAVSYIEPYLERHPHDWSLRYLNATLYVALEQNDAARTEVLRVLEDVPTRPEPHWLLGTLLRDAFHDRPAALAEFQKYLELAPAGEHAEDARRTIANGATQVADHPMTTTISETEAEHFVEIHHDGGTP